MADTTAGKSKAGVMWLNVLKYLIPVASTALSIWLHNQATVTQVEQMAGVVESGLEAATSAKE